MKEGIEFEKRMMVEEQYTAKEVGSGLLAVFATPSMIAMMEGCAAESVAAYLEEGQSTVGTMIQVHHLAATPIGMEVRCKSLLKEIDGRCLKFELEAYDEKGLIGKGIHERFIISSERFLEKTYQKLEK